MKYNLRDKRHPPSLKRVNTFGGHVHKSNEFRSKISARLKFEVAHNMGNILWEIRKINSCAVKIPIYFKLSRF
jgi:hypothetical protein